MMNFKEIQKLVKFCRAQGITEFKSGDLEFKITAEPMQPKFKTKTEFVEKEDNIPAWMKYSPEQLAVWSAPDPEIDEDQH